MRIQIFSDLHLELAPLTLPQPRPEVDVVILAGDIHSPGRKVPSWARRASVFGDGHEIIFVPGNHEYYGTVYEDEVEAMREQCTLHGVTFLSADVHTIDSVRFVGCTLWTDFALAGYVDVNMSRAEQGLNDYLRIERRAPARMARPTYSQEPKPPKPGPIVPLKAADTLAWHWQERSWLTRKLAGDPSDGVTSTVVVTHHAPSGRSIPSQYENHHLSPAYASELISEVVGGAAQPPSLWIHGHIHTNMDYMHASGCRVVANPRGYNHGKRSGGWESPSFDPRFTIEI